MNSKLKNLAGKVKEKYYFFKDKHLVEMYVNTVLNPPAQKYRQEVEHLRKWLGLEGRVDAYKEAYEICITDRFLVSRPRNQVMKAYYKAGSIEAFFDTPEAKEFNLTMNGYIEMLEQDVKEDSKPIF